MPAISAIKEVKDKTALVEDSVKELLTTMGFAEADVSCISQEVQDKTHLFKECLQISVEAEDSRRLIGAHGSHLSALTHIVRCVLRRKLDQMVLIKVDVNGYLAARERNLGSLAEEAAKKASETGRAIVLPPMNSAERRYIHTALANKQEISTESLGEEPNRRVIIRPVTI